MSHTEFKLAGLLDQCGPRLHRLLAKLTAYNLDTADELLQDLFLKMLTSTSFAAASNPEAYLFRSAINLAFDWRKKNSKSAGVLLESDLISETAPPVDRLIATEEIDEILSAMQQLSESDRDLISLRFIQGESNEWIAKRTQSTTHKVRARCSKAVARLRKILATTSTLKKFSGGNNHE